MTLKYVFYYRILHCLLWILTIMATYSQSILCRNNQKEVKLTSQDRCIEIISKRCCRCFSLSDHCPSYNREPIKSVHSDKYENVTHESETLNMVTSFGYGTQSMTSNNNRISVVSREPDNHLLAHYAFEGNVEDSSGNERHGVINGTNITFAPGVNGSAAVFDGSQMIVVDAFRNFVFGSEFALSFWFKRSAFNKPNTFITNNYEGRGEFEFKTGSGDGGTRVKVFLFFERLTPRFSIGAEFGIWHHVLLTYNGSYIAFYLNGQIVDGDSHCCTGPIPVSINPVCIGGLCYSNHRNFHGLIDEVKFYNVALYRHD